MYLENKGGVRAGFSEGANDRSLVSPGLFPIFGPEAKEKDVEDARQDSDRQLLDRGVEEPVRHQAAKNLVPELIHEFV